LAALLGIVIERLTIRPMVGQPLFSMAVITLGIELAIRPFNLDATALTGRSLSVPWGAGTWEWAGAIIPKSYIAAMVFAAIAGVAVAMFYRSRLGVAMRAVAFDQEAAMAQGIDVGRVFQIAWALGIALAALGGIVYGMAPFPPGGSVSQEIHPILAFRVLPVIVLGGLDSVVGAVYGGLMIAIAEVFAGQYLADYNSVLGPGYSTIVPYVVMMIVLIVRPFGLFGTPEIRRV
ncbi:MAG: branched-chain amino acid ABC transporter permease, partial [Actinomycetia bacterium]|nr:branched-chain amino acid ABC transporter permease [Actinomycetes bacterium]